MRIEGDAAPSTCRPGLSVVGLLVRRSQAFTVEWAVSSRHRLTRQHHASLRGVLVRGITLRPRSSGWELRLPVTAGRSSPSTDRNTPANRVGHTEAVLRATTPQSAHTCCTSTCATAVRRSVLLIVGPGSPERSVPRVACRTSPTLQDCPASRHRPTGPGPVRAGSRRRSCCAGRCRADSRRRPSGP